MKNWEKEFDKEFKKYIDWNFVISNNKPIKVGIKQLKDFIQNLLEQQKSKIKRVIINILDDYELNTDKKKLFKDKILKELNK